jgi:hypothetical protein
VLSSHENAVAEADAVIKAEGSTEELKKAEFRGSTGV